MNEKVRNNRFFKSAKDFRKEIDRFFNEILPDIGPSLGGRILKLLGYINQFSNRTIWWVVNKQVHMIIFTIKHNEFSLKVATNFSTSIFRVGYMYPSSTLKRYSITKTKLAL
jgi:hypothetical protein